MCRPILSALPQLRDGDRYERLHGFMGPCTLRVNLAAAHSSLIRQDPHETSSEQSVGHPNMDSTAPDSTEGASGADMAPLSTTKRQEDTALGPSAEASGSPRGGSTNGADGGSLQAEETGTH